MLVPPSNTSPVMTSDQFCSLVYSVSGLYFAGCFYTRFPNIAFSSLPPSSYDLRTQEALSTCGTAQNFAWYGLLSVSPFMVRFVQSLSVHWDSKHPAQLINVWFLYDLPVLYVHPLASIGWKVRDIDDTSIMLLLLEEQRYARLHDGQYVVTKIIFSGSSLR